MSDLEQPLSFEGQRRSEAILRLAQRESQKRRRKRTALRGAGAGTLVIAAVLVARSGFKTSLLHRGDEIVEVPPQQLPKTSSPPGIVVSQIQTDPTIVDRLAIHTQSKTWRSIDDEEFIRAMADAGK